MVLLCCVQRVGVVVFGCSGASTFSACSSFVFRSAVRSRRVEQKLIDRILSCYPFVVVDQVDLIPVLAMTIVHVFWGEVQESMKTHVET